MATRTTFDLSFPNLPEQPPGVGSLSRTFQGVYVNSMSGLRLGMIKEAASSDASSDSSTSGPGDVFRIYAVGNVALGRDEKVYLPRDLISDFNPVDPYFSRMKDWALADVIVDTVNSASSSHVPGLQEQHVDLVSSNELHEAIEDISFTQIVFDGNSDPSHDQSGMLSTFLSNIQSIFKETFTSPTTPTPPSIPHLTRQQLSATLPTGPGAAPLEDTDELHPLDEDSDESALPWTTIYVVDGDLCNEVLPRHVPQENQVIVLKRGGCSFSDKLRNIPSFAPDPKALQLVIVVSYSQHSTFPSPSSLSESYQPDPSGQDDLGSYYSDADADDRLIQPYLHEMQYTPAGLPRQSPIPMVMVGGGERTMRMFERERVRGVAITRRWWFESLGVRIENLIVV